VAC
jgi:hypothetical protein